MACRQTILIIEQDVNQLNGLRSILCKEGYNVISTYNPYALIEILRTTPPDLAIINVNIPKEFGFNILRKTKELLPGLPIIAMSVYSDTLTKRELNRLGADDFMTKPFDVELLKARIAQLAGDKKVTLAG